MMLAEFQALLSHATEAVDRDSAALLAQAADDLTQYAQAIGHERTGRMVATMHRIGPYPMGSGILEARIESGVWYAEIEVARGGSHDWATRTINEDQPRIIELQLALEHALVRALVGGG